MKVRYQGNELKNNVSIRFWVQEAGDLVIVDNTPDSQSEVMKVMAAALGVKVESEIISWCG